MDILRSNGTPGRENETQEQCVPVFTGTPDFHFGSVHSVPRLTNGAFLLCLQTIFKHATNGRALHIESFGKPFAPVYKAATARLVSMMGGISPSTIYMIGDNPHSDIKGALLAGDPWHAVLVRTGCFQGGDNDEEYPAHHVADHIHDAVKYALNRHNLL